MALADPVSINCAHVTTPSNFTLTPTAGAQNWNQVYQSGSSSKRKPNASAIASLSLADAELRIEHEATKSGRIRSVIRVDTKKNDAVLSPHTASAYLVIDRESVVTSEGLAALSNAVGALFSVFFGQAVTQPFHTQFGEFLGGEP